VDEKGSHFEHIQAQVRAIVVWINCIVLVCATVTGTRSQTSEWGCVNERRRREDRGAAGAEGGGCGRGCPPPAGEGSGRGLCPLPQIFFWIFKIIMTCFGALWNMDFILNVPAREGS